MAITPVGLDIGTGFTKAVGGGKRAIFPSLVGKAYGGIVRMGDMDVEDGGRGMVEGAGTEALRIGESRNGVLIRPVRHGSPYDGRGYALLAREALKQVGVEPADAVVCAGITYDARDQRDAVWRILKGIDPRMCVVIPQAVGTLVSCGRREGMVINIGHGTTEIMNVRSGGVDGVSLEKAADFVVSQISRRTDKGAYVGYAGLFEAKAPAVRKLVSLLAAYIADEAARMGTHDEVVLAGGGSQMPGMGEALGSAMKCRIITVDDPVMSNAIGFEAKAASIVARLAKEQSPE